MEKMSPFFAHRFHVDFYADDLDDGGAEAIAVCEGAFSEITGLEATMEPKEIKEGGRNYGSAQRVGGVSFGTVVLKRGLTTSRDLWRWFELINQGGFAHRRTARITLMDGAGEPVWRWSLRRCLPVKFKSADLNASGGEVGIEELHLAHEGLAMESTGGGA